MSGTLPPPPFQLAPLSSSRAKQPGWRSSRTAGRKVGSFLVGFQMKMQPQTTIAAIAKAKITSCICCIVVFSTRHTTGAPYLRSYATVLAILRCSPQSATPHYLVPQFWAGDYGATTAGCVRPLSLMTVDQGLLAMLFVKRCWLVAHHQSCTGIAGSHGARLSSTADHGECEWRGSSI